MPACLRYNVSESPKPLTAFSRAFYGPRDLTQDRRASTPLTARPSHNGGHHHARSQRRVPTSRTPSSTFLKMLRGGFAPSGYRPSNDQPIEFGALHVHFDMPLTIADLVRNARQESSRFPMTRTAPRFTPATSAQRTIELGQDVK